MVRAMKDFQESVARSQTLARGLATLALLKANFDSGIDHLDMLLPFVADRILCYSSDDFSAEDIRSALVDAYGLQVPMASIHVVLTRATRRGLISRQGGRYFRKRSIGTAAPDISRKSAAIRQEHSVIADALIRYASGHGLVISAEDDALAMIFEFISLFHVHLLLDPSEKDGGVPILLDQLQGLGSRETRVIARFLLQECSADSGLRPFIRRILEGYVLQNALLLKDITTAQSRFKDLTVYFDTSFLLNALGLTGEAAGLAARESLDLLRSTNARLAVFDATVHEIKRILHVYEAHLGSQSGIETLRPYPITRYLVAHHYSPSDVREASALLETHLETLGIHIVPIPDHKLAFTLDEAELTQRLRRPDETDTQPRVVHDVDCVAAILTIRAGHHSATFDSAKAVFATTTGLLVRNVKEWFFAQKQAGPLPVIHVLALSSIAWLKKPAAVVNLKLNELIALCSAALAPSPRTWGLFLKHLQKMREEKYVTEDEVVAVIASELTDSLLSQFDEDVEPDADTLTEIVNRVKSEYQAKASAEIEEVKLSASEQIAAAHADRSKAEERLQSSEKEHRGLVLQLRAKASSIARMIGWIFFILAIIVLVLGPVFIGTLVGSVASYIITAIGWFVGVLALLYGGYVKQWRASLELLVEKLMRRWFGVGEQ